MLLGLLAQPFLHYLLPNCLRKEPKTLNLPGSLLTGTALQIFTVTAIAVAQIGSAGMDLGGRHRESGADGWCGLACSQSAPIFKAL